MAIQHYGRPASALFLSRDVPTEVALDPDLVARLQPRRRFWR